MPKLKVPVSANDHVRGKDGPITLLEYGDYECPFCGKAYPILKEIEKHYDKQLRFVFRNFPLTQIHPFAEIAAETAEFAGAKGKFWEMHDLIYENQSRLSVPTLQELVETLGLSLDEYAEAIESQAFAAKVREDFLGGARSGVNGTPTLFLNGERFNGPAKFQPLVVAIDALLQNRAEDPAFHS